MTFSTDATIDFTFQNLKTWFSDLESSIKPDYVVGIARSAIRILQITGSDKLIGTRLISQHALPFFSDEDLFGKIVILFDDSVIFGSTLSKVRDYLLKRGAVVHCASFIIDKTEFFGESDGDYIGASPFTSINIDYFQKLKSDDVRKHHYALIRAILNSPFDYNLDFPTIILKLSDYENHDIPVLLNRLKKTGLVTEVIDVTTPISAEAHIYRFTAFINDMERSIFNSDEIKYLSGSKLRLTFVPNDSEIRLKVLPQFAVKDSFSFEKISFFDSRLNELIDKKSFQLTPQDIFNKQAIHRLISAFGSAILSCLIIDNFRSTIEPDFKFLSQHILLDDIRINVGSALAKQLGDFWLGISELDFSWEDFQKTDPILLDIDQNLLNFMKNEWRKDQSLVPEISELPYESLGKLFLSINDNEIRKYEKDARRQEIGLTYNDINIILSNEFGVSVDPKQVSVALDVCIDYGQAVPKVVKRGDYWIRASYSGEMHDADDLNQLKVAFHKAYTDFLNKKGVKPLNRLGIQKLTSSLKEINKWLPVSLSFSTLGRVASIRRTPNSEQPIIDWLVSGRNSVVLEEKVSKSHSKSIVPNPEFHSPYESIWSDADLFDFYTSFDFLATAYLKDDENNSMKLLVSTCRNHEYTLEAVVTEAYNWIFDLKTQGFDDLLRTAEKASLNQQFKTQVIEKLYWIIIFLLEADKKYDIFYKNFHKISEKLQSLITQQSYGGTMFWKFKLLPLLNSKKDSDIEHLFNILKPILTLMKALTKVFVNTIIHFEVFSSNELNETLKLHGVNSKKLSQFFNDGNLFKSIEEYNNDLRDQYLSRSILKKNFIISDLSSFDNVIQTCYECYDQISKAMHGSFFTYESIDGGFRYVLKGKILLRNDGSEVKRMPGIFILAMDVIGSTGSPETEEMNDLMLNYLRTKSDVYYEKRGDDGFTVCCENPQKLWDIGNELSNHAIRIRENKTEFKGLRKCLNRGNVAIVTDSQNTTIIRDLKNNSSLPKAVFLLEAYRTEQMEKFGKDSHNTLFVLDYETANELKTTLDLKFNETEKIPLTAKHFIGDFIYIKIKQ